MSKHQDTLDPGCGPDLPIQDRDQRFVLLDELFQPRKMLRSASEIAACYHEVCDHKAVRATYNVLEKGRTIPAWKHGSTWWARQPVIRAKIWSEECKAFADDQQRDLVRVHLVLTSILRLIPEQRAELARLHHDQVQFLGLMMEATETIERLLQF